MIFSRTGVNTGHVTYYNFWPLTNRPQEKNKKIELVKCKNQNFYVKKTRKNCKKKAARTLNYF